MTSVVTVAFMVAVTAVVFVGHGTSVMVMAVIMMSVLRHPYNLLRDPYPIPL